MPRKPNSGFRAPQKVQGQHLHATTITLTAEQEASFCNTVYNHLHAALTQCMPRCTQRACFYLRCANAGIWTLICCGWWVLRARVLFCRKGLFVLDGSYCGPTHGSGLPVSRALACIGIGKLPAVFPVGNREVLRQVWWCRSRRIPSPQMLAFQVFSCKSSSQMDR